MSGHFVEKDAPWDTYPDCGCQPDDCPDRESVDQAAKQVRVMPPEGGQP